MSRPNILNILKTDKAHTVIQKKDRTKQYQESAKTGLVQDQRREIP